MNKSIKNTMAFLLISFSLLTSSYASADPDTIVVLPTGISLGIGTTMIDP